MLSGEESGFAVGLDGGLFEGGEEPGVRFGSSGVVAVGGSDRPCNAGGDKHGENGGDKDEREQSADHRLDGGVVAEGAEVGVDVHEYQLPSFTVMWTWS